MPRPAAVLRTPESPGLRDHLISITRRLITERQTAQLTVRAIAREAGVADGVLYNYFADKEDLLAHALLADIEAAERTLPPPPSPGTGTIEASLAGHLRHILDLHERVMPSFAALLGQPKALARFQSLPRSVKGDNLRQHMSAHLTAEQRLGRLAPDMDADAAATLLVGACYDRVLPMLFRPWSQEPLESPERFTESLVRTLLNGVRGDTA
ncbi:TetR/AcrR family transcriptional regulator [Spongiactinospora rosea]|uniref:TetR/AcrR family transcriptional regulator n=1 Tax=Spongiactinospora rosea TaxID=2248750 RepID=A0A366LXW6_9ACTN|nr:TetR/AcrR family transcriptional regulator [Spongiactinospora rosea]RBQ18012.1 TetR/AcrR family transcriptional regulator [Spongiactinospora rosea]